MTENKFKNSENSAEIQWIFLEPPPLNSVEFRRDLLDPPFLKFTT